MFFGPGCDGCEFGQTDVITNFGDWIKRLKLKQAKLLGGHFDVAVGTPDQLILLINTAEAGGAIEDGRKDWENRLLLTFRHVFFPPGKA